ncbi:MAG: aminomethyltransferase family protein [Pseudomonadota bacterium]
MSDQNENPYIVESVAVIARRFEESPYLAKYDCPELIRGVYAGRFFPMSVGEDPIEGYWGLRREARLFDVPEKPVEISGPDAVRFLDYVLSRSVSTMKEGRGYYAVACTPKGGIFMDGVMFRLAEDRFWYVQADGDFEGWLAAHQGGFDVEISDPHSRVLQIQGPKSIDVMNAASGGAIDEGMGYFRSGYFDLGGQQLYVSRTGWTNELGFEVYSDDDTDHHALWDHLMATGAPHGLAYTGSRAMNMRRIEGGILDNHTDIDETMTPYQAGLGMMVDMEKGEFVGRTALQNADQRPLLFGLICETATPAKHCEVLEGGAVVGVMKSSTQSPTLGCGIGYVRFAHADEWIGRELDLRLADGSIHKAKVVPLPFFDHEKAIPRGVDRSIPEPPA